MGIAIFLGDKFGLFMGPILWIQSIIDVGLGEAYGLKATIDWIHELSLKNIIEWISMDDFKHLEDDVNDRSLAS